MTQLRIHLVGRDVADTMSCRMGVGKACYLCRGIKTIRIAESSDMDSWEALLRPRASFGKDLSFKKKMKWRMFLTPIPTDRYEVVGDHEPWRVMVWKRRSFGETDKMVIFREKCLLKRLLTFFNKDVFLGKSFKETSYKGRFMGKVLKTFFLFLIKI